MTANLDEGRTVSHPWQLEITERRFGVGDQRRDQVQQVAYSVQELDRKQRQRLWRGTHSTNVRVEQYIYMTFSHLADALIQSDLQ